MSTTAVTLYKSHANALLEQVAATGVQITPTQRKLLIAEGHAPIKSRPTNELTDDVAAVVRFSMRDLGIVRQPDAYDASRFLDVLREHFGEMSIADVKTAFELCAMGELDDFLPRNEKGQVIQHYQQFSLRYYVAVLKAYRNKQLDAKRAVAGKVAFKQLQAAEVERDPHADFASYILTVKGIAVAIAEGSNPTYLVTVQMEHILKLAKVIPATVVATDSDRTRAQFRMTKNRDSAVDLAIHNVLKSGGTHEGLENMAGTIAVRRHFEAEVRKMGPDETGKRFDALAAKERRRSRAPKKAKA